MYGYTDYLSEAAGKNTHITHLEDVILDDGPSGAHFAVGTLKAFGRMLNGGTVSRRMNVSVKWDGAPAVVFGPDPVDGRFFVGTKHAVFASTPKLAKTHGEIDKFYESGVKGVLHIALDELAALKPSVILQGDLIFTESTLKSQSIDGVDYVTFQPNTILYAVDVSSVLGSRITNAVLGIVIHTQYAGKSKNIRDFGSSVLSPSVFSQLRKTSRVVALDAGYDDVSGTATFTNEEREDFILVLSDIESLMAAVPRGTYDLIREEPFHSLFARFLNAQVRENKTKISIDDLIVWLDKDQAKEMSARKTPAGKETVSRSYNGIIGKVRASRGPLTTLFALHAAIVNAKNIVVQKLAQASRIATFVPAGDGFRITGPEGFVCVSHLGKMVKLVDRLEFSRINFAAIKSWK
jgi:hypothetical protein